MNFLLTNSLPFNSIERVMEVKKLTLLKENGENKTSFGQKEMIQTLEASSSIGLQPSCASMRILSPTAHAVATLLSSTVGDCLSSASRTFPPHTRIPHTEPN
jgi:hypothetical protein